MPWPIGMLPIEEPDQFATAGTIPCSSLGRSTPVGEPKPKLRIQ